MTTAEAVWAEFDSILWAAGSLNPWVAGEFVPDYALLSALLEVPMRSDAATQSGLRAKAVDVWIAAELRRAGFDADEVWPRATTPRVMPREISRLLARLPRAERAKLEARLNRSSLGVVGADARVLGRAYYKQVDVAISHWATGPELLISTKRMDSSMSNNALNRIEESYGDSHNLRGRHPLAALGYVLLTSTHAVQAAGTTAPRLFDLCRRLAVESGGYDASTVIVVDWDLSLGAQERPVHIQLDAAGPELDPARFFGTIVRAVLARTPIEDHTRARQLHDLGTFPD